MVEVPDSVARFLSGKRFAVAGVSRNAGQPANAIFQRLVDSGYEVVPVNPRSGEVEGVKCYASVLDVPGDLDGAIAQLDEAMGEATTGDEARDALEHSELYRIKGGLRVLQGRDAEAIASFERSLELDPDRLDAHLKLGNALARNRRFADALEHYDRVLDELPDNSDVLMKKATLLINLNRSGDAIAAFEEAVASDAENATLRLRFAEALEFLGQGGRAAEERRIARDLAAGGEERAELLLTEARGLTREGRFEDAIARLEQILDDTAASRSEPEGEDEPDR